MPTRPTARLLALAMLMASGVGCGPTDPDQANILPVSGKVTYKGKPVPKGTITFHSDGGRMATGEIQEDGSYSLTTARPGDGAVAGHHRVSIVANEGDPTLNAELAGVRPAQEPGAPEVQPARPIGPRGQRDRGKQGNQFRPEMRPRPP